MADAQGTGEPLAIICGGGSFPGAVADAVARAGLAGLAVTSGSTMIAEPVEVTAAADRAKIFFVGVREYAAP